MNIDLTRHAYLSSCTLGWLRVGSLELATIERPWLPHPHGPGGKQRESCIPDGEYLVQPWNSARFPNTFILANNALGVYLQPNLIPPRQAWGRSAILIHAGNTVEDVIGCIAVGRRHALAGGQHSVLESRNALDDLRATLGRGTTHQLTIRPIAGTQEIAA